MAVLLAFVAGALAALVCCVVAYAIRDELDRRRFAPYTHRPRP